MMALGPEAPPFSLGEEPFSADVVAGAASVMVEIMQRLKGCMDGEHDGGVYILIEKACLVEVARKSTVGRA